MSPIASIAAAVGSIDVYPDHRGRLHCRKRGSARQLGECSTCHLASAIAVPSTGTTGFCAATPMPTTHFAITGACTLCHTAGYALGKTVMDHSGVSLASCNSCHNGAAKTIGTGTYTAVGTSSVSHIATTSGDCVNCHTASGIPTKTVNASASYSAPGAFKVTSYVANLHSYVSTASCTSCHGGTTTYTGMSPITTIAAAVGSIDVIPRHGGRLQPRQRGQRPRQPGRMRRPATRPPPSPSPARARTGFCGATMLPVTHFAVTGGLLHAVPHGRVCTGQVGHGSQRRQPDQLQQLPQRQPR